MDRIITERPKGMSFDEYKRERSNQLKRERLRKHRGDLVYKSVEIAGNPDPTVKDDRKYRITYPPAVKTFDSRGRVVYKPMKKG